MIALGVSFASSSGKNVCGCEKKPVSNGCQRLAGGHRCNLRLISCQWVSLSRHHECVRLALHNGDDTVVVAVDWQGGPDV